jgi:hypothetical protein
MKIGQVTRLVATSFLGFFGPLDITCYKEKIFNIILGFGVRKFDFDDLPAKLEKNTHLVTIVKYSIPNTFSTLGCAVGI